MRKVEVEVTLIVSLVAPLSASSPCSAAATGGFVPCLRVQAQVGGWLGYCRECCCLAAGCDGGCRG